MPIGYWISVVRCVCMIAANQNSTQYRLPIAIHRAILIGHKGKLKNYFSCLWLGFDVYTVFSWWQFSYEKLRFAWSNLCVCVCVQKRTKLCPYEENTCIKQLFDNISNENWIKQSKIWYFNGKYAVNSIFHIYTVRIGGIFSMRVYQSMFASCFTSFLSIFRVLIEFIKTWQGNIVLDDWIQITTAKWRISTEEREGREKAWKPVKRWNK